MLDPNFLAVSFAADPLPPAPGLLRLDKLPALRLKQSQWERQPPSSLPRGGNMFDAKFHEEEEDNELPGFEEEEEQGELGGDEHEETAEEVVEIEVGADDDAEEAEHPAAARTPGRAPAKPAPKKKAKAKKSAKAKKPAKKKKSAPKKKAKARPKKKSRRR